MNSTHLDHKRHHKTHEEQSNDRPKTVAVGKRIMEIVDYDQEEYERYLKTKTYIHRGKKYKATGPEVFGSTYYMSLASQKADLILKQRDEHRARGYIKT